MCGIVKQLRRSPPPYIPISEGRGITADSVKDRLKHFKRLHIRVVAGKPFTLPVVKGKDRDAAMQEYTDEVMCWIAALLTPERRGLYADNPRLKELLQEAKAS